MRALDFTQPIIAEGDNFDLELDSDTLIETYVLEATDDAIVLAATSEIMEALTSVLKLTEAEYQGHKVPLGKPMREIGRAHV